MSAPPTQAPQVPAESQVFVPVHWQGAVAFGVHWTHWLAKQDGFGAAQVPQDICCPQLLATLPHCLPLHAWPLSMQVQ